MAGGTPAVRIAGVSPALRIFNFQTLELRSAEREVWPNNGRTIFYGCLEMILPSMILSVPSFPTLGKIGSKSSEHWKTSHTRSFLAQVTKPRRLILVSFVALCEKTDPDGFPMFGKRCGLGG
jgi:hypothetical protein